MAGGGKVYSLVLFVALLSLFTTTYAARSQPATVQSLNTELMNAFGASGADEPCCKCACTLIYPPEANMCFCAGQWEGACPSVCKNCNCDENNRCFCQDGFTIKYNDCMSVSCYYDGASEGAHKGM